VLTTAMRGLDPLRRFRRIRQLRRNYPNAEQVICVSRGVANDLVRHVPAVSDKLRVIHNPVALDACERDAPLHPWLSQQLHPVILGAGRLSPQKDFATLLRAFARLEARLHLIIIGDGPERNRLLRLAHELGIAHRVALPGFVSNPRAYMASAALFVLSSRWEGFGNVLVEAMAEGTPVVATDCESGPRDILMDGLLGPLAPVGDHETLALAMRAALSAPTDSSRLRDRAADFSPARIAERYLQELLPQRGP
jgi:glycosyltransferase involved in cell wall biosynthesis